MCYVLKCPILVYAAGCLALGLLLSLQTGRRKYPYFALQTSGHNWSNYATKTSDGMSSDDAEDDSDIGECVCGEVECLCVRGPAKLAGNPYAAYNSLPKRVSQPPKKTPGGIKQPKKKKPAAPKSRKSRQETTRVASSSPCANAKESRRMQEISNLPSGIITQPI